jgi:hypothetical protein
MGEPPRGHRNFRRRIRAALRLTLLADYVQEKFCGMTFRRGVGRLAAEFCEESSSASRSSGCCVLDQALACSGLPSGTTCTASPATLTLSGPSSCVLAQAVRRKIPFQSGFRPASTKSTSARRFPISTSAWPILRLLPLDTTNSRGGRKFSKGSFLPSDETRLRWKRTSDPNLSFLKLEE